MSNPAGPPQAKLPTSAGPARSNGLFASLRRLLDSGLEMAQVRIELLVVELELEKKRVFDGLLWAALAMLLLGVGLVLLVGLVLMMFWDGYRLPALAVMSLLFLGAGLWLGLTARQKLSSRDGALNGSRAELAGDRQALRDPA